ncbi:flagellar filament capping protein FliD [Teredinibacter purpureus]|uniref:flagellar filament capping protein FliD n=1 Tax=Teredinibacter purpureus TaxID=2731756 RepID=UPI0005F8641D|nr:flagellar filament capping protein FliD [Teredinibacter purpureus]
MIDNNIIQSLGVGSGIDTPGLTKQLTEIERAAPQQRIDSAREKAETQISDYGLLSSAMATLQDAATVLSDPEGMYSKTASYTDSSALVPLELDTDVQAGTYNFEVTAIAKSQSLTSTTFTNTTDAVGEGTLTFSFGNVTADVDGEMTAFVQDFEEDSIDVVIDSTNNSLEGLRDAINAKDFGVQATIVNSGSGYVLQINAESGATNELEIKVVETSGASTDTDDSDLSRFAFNMDAVDASQLTQNQGGQDAALTINGLDVTRETNTIDDIVDGLKFDLLKESPGETITVTVSEDKAFAEQNVRDFVEAFNLFLEAIEPAVGTYEQDNEEGDAETITGSLANDSLANSIISRIRSVISSAIPGLADSGFTSLGAIGLRTELDGTMSIDEDAFSKAFEKDFESVQNLFAPLTATSDSDIYINSYNDSTTAGEYDVVITTPPARGYYTGGALTADFTTPGFSPGADVYTFTVDVNGTESAALAIPAAVYATESDLATAMQTLINADTNLADNGAAVTVTYNSGTNNFDIASTAYGASSIVSITDASMESVTELGLTVVDGTQGQTVVGTINGETAFGSANVLLPALGEPGEGLALVVGENTTSATVNFSRGFGGELGATLDEFLSGSGLIAYREDNLETSIDGLDEDQEALDRRMTAFEERLINQFIAMERIINSLNSSGSFLENLINTLPFTASRD